MSRVPVLYIGVAAPLVEVAQVWMADLSAYPTAPDCRAKVAVFPRREINAYQFEFPKEAPGFLTFRTSAHMPQERVQMAIETWLGQPPRCLGEAQVEAVSALGYRRALAELCSALQGQPLQIFPRIGLTLQGLQKDLALLQPELVLLDCHGTAEGCLLFEDGVGQVEVVSGERLLPLFRPHPTALLLSACYSGGVLRRAQEAAAWQDGALVYIDAKTPVETAACVAFEAMFYTALLGGASAAEAFRDAQQYLAADPMLGDLMVTNGDTPPSQKFCLSSTGHDVRLAVPQALPSAAVQAHTTRLTPPYAHRIRRASERFVGRRQEMQRILTALLPPRAGIGILGGDRRVVTLTKEGGIGKTSIALEVVDWVRERELFHGGVVELSCERLTSDQAFLTALLTVFGLPPEAHKGDLLTRFAEVLQEALPANQDALLVLDNLDDLCGQHVVPEVRQRAVDVLETALTIVPHLRILATCRWPLGVSDHEFPLEIPPMDEEEARDVFLSHLDDPAHRLETRTTWSQLDSPIRQLVRLSGRHPQSLRLLARQMGRKGLTLAKLRDEAHDNLLAVLQDPLASDNDADRLKKVERSYELSYQHLSEAGKCLFARLSRLPGGIWCGDSLASWFDWQELLGENWRTLLENELDYFALVHYDEHRNGTGTFAMLPPMLEFARQKYDAVAQQPWEATWIDFWQQHIRVWDQCLSGRLPDEMDIPDDQRQEAGVSRQQFSKGLFEQTQSNWLHLLDDLIQVDCAKAASILLDIVSFCQFSGQLVLLKNVTRRIVDALRPSGVVEKLAPCLDTLGTVLRNLGERTAARQALEEALGMYRDLAQAHPAAYRPAVATTLNNLGTVLGDLGERSAARQAYEEALGMYRDLAQAHPAAYTPDVAMTLNNLGTVLGDLGEWAAARQAYEEALGIRRDLAQAHPAAYRPAVATTLNNLGTVLSDLGERSAALGIYLPFVSQEPQAFGDNFRVVLRNYIQLTEENVDDPWWQLWRQLQEATGDAEG